MEYLFDFLLFLGKTVVLLGGLVLAVTAVVGSLRHARQMLNDEQIEVKQLNDRFKAMQDTIESQLISPEALKVRDKARQKERKAKHKAEKKALKAGNEENKADAKKRLFVLDFKGDIQASQTDSLREEISTILTIASEDDEVVLRLESPGGTVHGYGFASSQLQRLRERNVTLTVAVDKVAASGGYMMASVASNIIAAPFSIIGSIGVVMSLPNFNKLLKKHNVEFEQVTAGDFKRTLTMFGENSEEDREKTKEELESIHQLFKQFIGRYRPQVDMAKVATGETWHATTAKELQLVDELQTSDDYLLNRRESHDIFSVKYTCKKPLNQRFSQFMRATVESVFAR